MFAKLKISDSVEQNLREEVLMQPYKDDIAFCFEIEDNIEVCQAIIDVYAIDIEEFNTADNILERADSDNDNIEENVTVMSHFHRISAVYSMFHPLYKLYILLQHSRSRC